MTAKIKMIVFIAYVIAVGAFTMVGVKVTAGYWLGDPWATFVGAAVFVMMLLELRGDGPIAKYWRRKGQLAELEQEEQRRKASEETS